MIRSLFEQKWFYRGKKPSPCPLPPGEGEEVRAKDAIIGVREKCLVSDGRPWKAFRHGKQASISILSIN
jgi:hypothetical protein